MAAGASDPDLLRAVRWPLLLVGLAGAAILLAFVLDRTPAREYALTIGGPALTVVLPVALGWLAAAVVVHVLRRRRPTR
jgi:hypothetical protein